MHFLAFAMKRAHWRCVQTFWPVAEFYGLTPARFDLLHVMMQRQGQATQATIRRVLGVSATVISRMVQALEKLGFVTRMRDFLDRRTKLVRFTMKGSETMCEIVENLVRSGHVQLAMESAIGWPAPQAETSLRVLFKTLRFMAQRLGDWSMHLNIGQPPLAFEPPWVVLAPECEPRVTCGI